MSEQFGPVITISASYGAGGSVIAPRLAEALALPLVDRLLTADVSAEAVGRLDEDPHSEEGLSEGERAASPGSRLFTYLARASGVYGLSAPPLLVEPEEELRQQAEAGLAEIREGGGGVVLGRAGAVVLAERPRTFHVRLDGPPAARARQAAVIEGIPEERATERLAQTDRSRELWVRRLYRADPLDPGWYHLWLDTTAFGLDGSVDLLLDAAHRFLGMAPAW
ncbi:MAG TPA: cytidylate kinase-like family protein [Acidimicrobiales bacterium]|nr:cytidylate kinase-like family protein [Acidimicrobiales bacterium]